MNFFKSILSEDSDPLVPENPQSRSQDGGGDDDSRSNGSSTQGEEEAESDRNPGPDAGAGAWSIGGLWKTLANRSESVIEIYRRDLKEFGSGLQKETVVFREVASRAVKDLPTSIEAGASVAHGSLETVGHAIDGVWKSTAEIISQGKDALLQPSDGESDSDALNYSNHSVNSTRYSRFDALLRSIQSDQSTYCDEPDDLEDYSKWKLGFLLEEKSEEIKSLIEENGTIEEIYKKVAPNVVDRETFWCRYFYKVNKLKQREDVRANLVKRAIVGDDEELTWDVDDDEDPEETNGQSKSNTLKLENRELESKELAQDVKEGSSMDEPQNGSSELVDDKEENKSNVDKGNVGEEVKKLELGSEQSSEVKNVGTVLKSDEKQGPESKKAEPVSKSDEKEALDGKVDSGGSCKDSDVSIVSTQPSLPEEEDLGWDEIEDVGSGDEKRETHAGNSNRADLQKRLSVAADVEDEDLTWDIEDDDETAAKLDAK
ncbi:uncharacterized protein LOC127787731 [Diospyros lotus]|uniref:uncharacterized protein LOC127787731 n=1 Tax=Diospyros lotus TaxID=55363 RepID=UPI00224F91C0|nr:uncharacterized protein LOC127787731 [Diospyros lotus]